LETIISNFTLSQNAARLSKMKLCSTLTLLLLIASAMASIVPGSNSAPTESEEQENRNLATFNAAITSFTMIDTVTNFKVCNIFNGTIFDVTGTAQPTLPSFNINASFVGTGIRSVVFSHNGNLTYHIERNAWYSFCGNQGSAFERCSLLGAGQHTVTATPYSRLNGRGMAGTPHTVTFSIVAAESNQTNTTATAAPSLAPVASPTSSVRLLNVTALSPTTVDVSFRPASVDFQVTVQDATVGVQTIFIEVLHAVKNTTASSQQQQPLVRSDVCFADEEHFDVVTCPNEAVGRPNITLTIPQFLAPGMYPIQIVVTDFATGFQESVFTPLVLKQRSFVSAIEVVNITPLLPMAPPTGPSPVLPTRAPTPAPVITNTTLRLLDVAPLSPLIIDVSNQPATVDLQVTAVDAVAGIYAIYVEVYDVISSMAPTLQSLLFTSAFCFADEEHFEVVSCPNRTVGREAIALSFPQFIAPGNYPFAIVVQSFETTGTTIFTSDELVRRSLPHVVEVVNTNVDETVPTLRGFNVSSAVLNVSAFGPEERVQAQILAVVQDDKSGFSSAIVEAVHVDGLGTAISYIDMDDLDTPVGEPILVEAVLSFVDSPLQLGVYRLSVQLSDRADNTVSFGAQQLADRGFSSTITLV
jgi:hypothetical protein